MTVYELIQNLADFDANQEVHIKIEADFQNLVDAVRDNLTVLEVHLDGDIYEVGKDGSHVQIVCDAY